MFHNATASPTPRILFCLSLALIFALIAAPPGWAQKKSPRKAKPAVSKPGVTTMEINTAVMVTVEEDFGTPAPTIAQALQMIERRYKPEGTTGRTFAILDAYGEKMRDGKLHLSMHVSSERPGGGSLVNKRTGKTMWECRIRPPKDGRPPFEGKNLTIMVDNGEGKDFTIDGSNNPSSVLTANVREVNRKLQDIWPNGTERDFIFVYSACGCPVHVMVKRVGDRTVRTKDLPVIFPDDPAAVAIINRLMRWQ